MDEQCAWLSGDISILDAIRAWTPHVSYGEMKGVGRRYMLHAGRGSNSSQLTSSNSSTISQIGGMSTARLTARRGLEGDAVVIGP